MHERAFGRAVALGAAAVLLAATAAFADTIGPSTDGLTVVGPNTVDLGVYGPGASVSVDLGFQLTCSGWTHVAPGTTVSLALLAATISTGGTFGAATPATVGPVPASWPAGGAGCSSPAQVLSMGAPSHVTFTAPTTTSAAGTPYSVTLAYSVSSTPAGAAGTIAGVTLDFEVSGDKPPTLDLPGPMSVEGNTTGGATVTYAVSAADPEDASPPAVSCSPTSGAFFPLGATTVTCSATDAVGQTTTGTFAVSVVDTTPPTLSGVPSDLSVETYDPSGALVAYSPPTAADIVDPAPIVACAPAPGSLLPVGTTAVACTATDHSGNQASVGFTVTVALVHLVAVVEAPVGPTNTLAVNPGRTLPVKAIVTRDGVPVTSGAVDLSLATCSGAPLRPAIPLAWQEDRWFVGLDTSGLAGCVAAAVTWDGHLAGTFTMDASVLGPSADHPRRR